MKLDLREYPKLAEWIGNDLDKENFITSKIENEDEREACLSLTETVLKDHYPGSMKWEKHQLALAIVMRWCATHGL